MSIPAVIPVNRLDRTKGRLAELLGPQQREALTLATLATVVEAATAAGLEPIILSAGVRLAELLGAPARIVLEDPSVQGLNAQLEVVLESLGEQPVLILHADLPLAEAGAIRGVIAACPDAGGIAIVRSGDGGTNAMYLRPPGRFALAYGPASFEAHARAASEAGMRVCDVAAPALALDLDTPADIRTLLSTAEGRSSRAGRMLVDSGIEDVLARRRD